MSKKPRRAQSFFTVFSPQGEAPARFTHPSHGSAFREAHRLARLHPDQQFFVMESKSRPIGGIPPRHDKEAC